MDMNDRDIKDALAQIEQRKIYHDNGSGEFYSELDSKMAPLLTDLLATRKALRETGATCGECRVWHSDKCGHILSGLHFQRPDGILSCDPLRDCARVCKKAHALLEGGE